MRKPIQLVQADTIAGVIVLCDDGSLWAIQPEYGADLKVLRWVWKSFPSIPQPEST
jgi:hypothetical protein